MLLEAASCFVASPPGTTQRERQTPQIRQRRNSENKPREKNDRRNGRGGHGDLCNLRGCADHRRHGQRCADAKLADADGVPIIVIVISSEIGQPDCSRCSPGVHTYNGAEFVGNSREGAPRRRNANRPRASALADPAGGKCRKVGSRSEVGIEQADSPHEAQQRRLSLTRRHRFDS
jgi:hypothetical protein